MGSLATGQVVAEVDGNESVYRISLDQRSRYEVLSGQFRAGGTGGDQVAAFRTLLRFDADWDPVGIVTEMMDSRQALADMGSALNTSTVDAFAVLQAHAVWRPHPGHQIRLGRMTRDLGSRRLVARNRYRNTLNSFTGAHWMWDPMESPLSAEAFYWLPVQRLPTDLPSLLGNEIARDEESFRRQFWGLVFRHSGMPWRTHLAASYFGLHEEPDWGLSRQLQTLALRWHRPQSEGSVDFELEAALQWGRSRLAAAGPDLDPLASFAHASAGYTFEMPWKPRLGFAIDYASGDSNPADGRNGRFDTLFGARRFEYGPTGIYGAIARGNLISPEVRLTAKPTQSVSFTIAHRGVWLESAKDAWTSAGVADPTGNSGHHVGQQVEARVRWRPEHKRFEIAVGVAHLFTGSFLDRAPNASRQGDTTYGYAQTTLRF